MKSYNIYIIENQTGHIYWMRSPIVLKYQNKEEALNKYRELMSSTDLSKYHVMLFEIDDGELNLMKSSINR